MVSIRPIPEPNLFIKLKNKISVIVLKLNLFDKNKKMLLLTP